MKALLPVDGPLDPGATLARYRIWGEDPANRVSDDRFRRVLRFDGRLIPYEVRWSGPVDDARLSIDMPGERAPAVRDAVLAEVRASRPRLRSSGVSAGEADPALASLIVPSTGSGRRSRHALECAVPITAQHVTSQLLRLRASLVHRFGRR